MWVKSATNRVILPAAASSSGVSGAADPSFLLEEPPEGKTGETISLSGMKTKITTTNDMVDDSIDGHRECLLAKFKRERSGTSKLPAFYAEVEKTIDSGQPAGTAIVTFTRAALSTDEPYDRAFLEGPNSDSFRVTTTTWAPVTRGSGYIEGSYSHDFAFEMTRPLPKGQYVFHDGYQKHEFFPCGYTPPHRRKWTVDVEAPEGTLHELFFDPVTVGSTVAADTTNGVLKPVGFTDSNGGSATLSSISYEFGTVKVEVTPDDALAGQVVDIIELDGSVSLSLVVDEATVDAANDTLSWTVSSQPWEDGDLLMVRIREAR